MKKLLISIFLIVFTLYGREYYQIQWIDTLDFYLHQIYRRSDGGIVIGKANNIYVTETVSGPGLAGHCFTVKYDSIGTILLADTLDGGDSKLSGIAVDSIGNIYITGRNYLTNRNSDYYTVKYNSDFQIQWIDTFGYDSFDYAYDIAADKAGNVYVTGSAEIDYPRIDYLTLKYDSLGVIQWVDTVNNHDRDVAYGLAVDKKGNVYVTGASQTSIYSDMLTLKYDSLGTIQWMDTIDFYHSGHDVSTDGRGNIYVAGYYSGSDNTLSDIFVVKYDSLGVIRWTDTVSAFDEITADYITVDVFGNLYVTANFGDFEGGSFITIKYDSLGTIQWMDTFNIDSLARGKGIAVDGQENIYVSGNIANSYPPDYLITMKFLKTIGIDSAVAFDGLIQEEVIDEDDYVVLYFSEETNKPLIDNSNIDSIFSLSFIHSWLDGSGNIENAIWNTEGTELTINLSVSSSAPTIAVGDTIKPDGTTIQNQRGGTCESRIVLIGDFGQSGVEKTVKSTELNVPSINIGNISFSYQVNNNEPFSIRIYNVEGRLVKEIQEENNGIYKNRIADIPSGIYLFELKNGSNIIKKKTVLLK